ncbi:MAG: hypothetical protein IH899_20245 [Planctomycetes bacterium]|nr:hypothetical protein [Planctomycetota bacterium]
MTVTDAPSTTLVRTRRWYCYKLRTLFVAVVAIAAALGYFSDRLRTQRAAVAAIRKAGGDVIYDWQYCDPQSPEDFLNSLDREPPVPKWVVAYLGDDVFYSVAEVIFLPGWRYTAFECTDDTLTQLHRLTSLKRVTLRMTRVTDEGVKKLQQALPKCTLG